MSDFDLERRFGGLKRLYGDQALHIIAAKAVMVVGIGGVGSWAAEALARSGIGRLVLVDLDVVSESNINRQIHALSSTLGKSKVEAMAERLYEINPHLQLELIDDFIDPSNAHAVIEAAAVDVVLDCADQVQAKIAMTLVCKELGVHLIMCGGAGGKRNSLALNFTDLSRTRNDALLAKIRQQLRKQYGFAKGSDAQGRALKKVPSMGVPCLWIDEPALMPWSEPADDGATQRGPQGLACAGYGSCVTVTAAMGLAAVNQVLKHFYA
ncbi:MAG: tRNA threonylcarbamoyladenosine dehydratase [Alcaligenaceae bacterium]|nr:tRNA threonylcarbamoyladenosine dehydratase [Alcaligenaceae bacterium]